MLQLMHWAHVTTALDVIPLQTRGQIEMAKTTKYDTGKRIKIID